MDDSKYQSDGDNLNKSNEILITHKFNDNCKPNELNISIECTADNLDLSDLRSNKDLQLENEELQRFNREFKSEINELKEQNKELESEIDNLDLKTQELEDQIECLTNELNEQKVQNIELARELQSTKIQLANDKKSNLFQIKDYNDIFENYKMFNRAYLDQAYFIDTLIKRFIDLNETCNLICNNKFIKFNPPDDFTTINYDHKDILMVYIENIEMKLDSLLLDDSDSL